MTILYFIIILGIIIFIHELGHFIFAKMFGVTVYEFAIGMGPKILKKQSKKSETLYSLRLIPLGGFCALAGEGEDDEEKTPPDKLLDNKKWWQKVLIMFAGAGFNFLLAFILLFCIALFHGAPETKAYIGGIKDDYPAYNSGLEKGDLILSVNDRNVVYWDDLTMLLELDRNANPKKIEVLKQDGTIKTYNIKPKKDKIKKQTYYRVGIESDGTLKHGLGNAFSYATNKFASLFKSMITTFEGLFTGKISVANLSGPVGIYSVVDDTAAQGFINILSLIAFLSINIGFVNLLPLPALDGGRIVITCFEALFRKKLPKKVELWLINMTFFLLIALIIFVTWNDIIRFFT